MLVYSVRIILFLLAIALIGCKDEKGAQIQLTKAQQFIIENQLDSAMVTLQQIQTNHQGTKAAESVPTLIEKINTLNEEARAQMRSANDSREASIKQKVIDFALNRHSGSKFEVYQVVSENQIHSSKTEVEYEGLYTCRVRGAFLGIKVHDVTMKAKSKLVKQGDNWRSTITSLDLEGDQLR